MHMLSDAVRSLIESGLHLQRQGQLAEAEDIYREALLVAPQHPIVLHLLGTVVGQAGRWFEAIDLLQQSLRIQPADPKAWNNLATAFLDAGHCESAREAAQRALSLAPDYSAARFSWASACYGVERFSEAVDAFRLLATTSSPHKQLAWPGMWRAAAAGCDWAAAKQASVAVDEMLARGEMVLSPFDTLMYRDDPLLHRISAESLIEQTLKREVALDPVTQGQAHWVTQSPKIRLAYISADFHEHATAYLMAELFESHDRQKFEIIAVSFGPDDGSAMRQRLHRAFDQFWDVRLQTPAEIAHRMRSAEVDIAIDLKGFTRDSRPSILLHKPAPVVVNYLGYPGTMGTPIYDYLLGDAIITPQEHAANYAEQLVQMPHSYQVNDTQRPIALEFPSRSDEGLPSDGFVFAAFNNVFKITPAFFAVWMRLLGDVPGSVLWMICDDEGARANLQKEALAHGVDAKRLVFARRLPLDVHLARHAHADLLLDNLPYNAHTTTSDALWAGVPVVTCMGQAFAGRVAASLLNAVGLPELVTHSLPEYEALALRLASNPHELQRMRAHLKAVRSTTPLFDTERFTRDLESAYVHMHERRLQGLPPEDFAVPEILGAGMQPLRSVPPSLQTSP